MDIDKYLYVYVCMGMCGYVCDKSELWNDLSCLFASF